MANTDTASKSNNRIGHNQFTARNNFSTSPYQLKFVQCKAMLDDGKTYDQIRAVTGMSHSTIARVSKGEIELSPSWVKSIKKVESNKLTGIIHAILDSITPDVIAASSLLQRTTAASQLVDKRRLIDGESTHNISHAGLIETLDADRAELMKRLATIEAGE